MSRALVLVFALSSGCASTFVVGATLKPGEPKHEDPVTCKDVWLAMIPGVFIDALITGVAIESGETFSTPDKIVLGLGIVDVGYATKVAIDVCRGT